MRNFAIAGTAQRFKSGGAEWRAKQGKVGVRGLAPGKFLRPHPLERRKTPLSKKDVCVCLCNFILIRLFKDVLIQVHIKLQFL